jgi:hypothetical protein
MRNRLSIRSGIFFDGAAREIGQIPRVASNIKSVAAISDANIKAALSVTYTNVKSIAGVSK